jgi:hypothetical protein
MARIEAVRLVVEIDGDAMLEGHWCAVVALLVLECLRTGVRCSSVRVEDGELSQREGERCW